MEAIIRDTNPVVILSLLYIVMVIPLELKKIILM